MSEPSPPRKPRVFDIDDPAVVVTAGEPPRTAGHSSATPPPAEPSAPKLPTAGDFKRGIRWGALFLSAMVSLAALSASLAFTRFVSDALARNDWVGWTATALAAVGLFALAVIVLKELVGLFRLARLSGLRTDILAALREKDRAKERHSVARLKEMMADRPDMKWSLARLAEHEADVGNAGDLLKLTEREVMVPLDRSARRLILKSAKRVSMVTALSPFVWIAMVFVLVENLRLLRLLAGLYGGRPGFVGSLRLARLVASHILATGGLAMTDDLIGQFVGQDLLARLSRRLGEGAFNGAMTARIGTAAIEVTRPLPFLEADPVRARDILPELLRSWSAKVATPPQRPSANQ